MDLPPLNEWVVDELTKTRDALSDLMERHEDILNRLSGVCRKNDELRAAGVELAVFVHELVLIMQDPEIFPDDELKQSVMLEDAKKALDRWRETNV